MIAKKLLLVVAGIPLTFAGCGGDNLTLPSEGQPAQIEVVSTGLQGRVNSELEDQLIVRVTDSEQRPVQGATVTFVLEEDAGGGSVSPTATTDTAGLATASVALGTQVGQMTGRAEVPVDEDAVPVTTGFSVTVLPEDASEIVMVSGDIQSGPVNSLLPQPLVVQVRDPFGNPIPGVTVQWSVEGGGSVSAASTVTDGGGQTSVTRTLGGTAGTQTTLASVEDLAGSPVRFTHITTAGNAARVNVVSGNGQQGAPGSTLPADLVVEVLDENNNPIVGRAVTWVVGTGEGSVNPETSMTDGQGRASTKWTLGTEPGRNTLTAVVSGVGIAAFSAMGTKTASSTSITSHQPEPSSIGQAVEVRVQVTGSGGAPTGSVSVTADGAAPCTVTLADGTGSCTLTFQSAGNQRITATYAGDGRFNGSSDSENHRVNAANTPPTAAFAPPSCTAGQACQFNDGSSDSDGSVIGWTWDFGDGQGSTDKNPTNTYAAAGTYNVKLTVRDDDGATSEVTQAVSVSAAPPLNFPPVATDDSYNTSVGTPFHAPDEVRFGLLINDADLDGDPLSVTAGTFATASGGSVIIAADGSFDYTPPPAPYTGPDSFTYTVNDNRGGSDTGTATITIQ